MKTTSINVLLRRVLTISDDANTQNLIKHALHVLDDVPVSYDEPQELLSATSLTESPCNFWLSNVDDWKSAFENLEDGKQSGLSFSLVILSVRADSWDMVHENIERIWELDNAIRCILCVAEETETWPASLPLSRPDQWAIFRTSGLPEELLQLALCLSGTHLTFAKGMEDTLTVSDLNHDLVGEATDSISQGPVDQEAELASARDELATSKVYVNNVLRSMADSLLVIDANLTIGSVNPSLLNLLGYQEDELLGQSPGLIFGEEFSQGSIIENLLMQGSVSGIESSFLTSDGQLIPISVSGSMMRDEDGQFQGLVCVAQDITERKRMEEEKLQLHEQLLETSRQLGMAEVASDVLHNIGNVLNSINVSIGVVADLTKKSMVGDVARISQLLNKHQDDLGAFFSTSPKGKQIPAYLEKLSGQLVEEQRTAIAELERLRENAHHAQQCVSSQQDLAKVKGITEPVSVIELMEEAVAANQEFLETSQINVIREFHEIPLLIVDKRQVVEVMADVIRNACQAMASVSTKQLVVCAKLIPGPPDSVCLEIQDSGVGIAPNDLVKIFGQGNTTEEGVRSMSLHNGANMAKNLGGALRAHSEGIGQGATFSLELPGNFHFPDL